MNLDRSLAMTMKIILWVIMILSTMICLNSKFSKATLSEEEDLELEYQLKILNKPPIHTYKTKEGEIIDCIDINKQPALDHPLLKNHKVQARPSSYPESLGIEKSPSKSKREINLVLKNNRKPCPSGTVPIRRTLKEDLIRIKSQSNSKPHFSSKLVRFPSDQDVVSLSMKFKDKASYYGAIASMAVYNLTVAQDQSSSTNIWVVGGPPQQLNALLVGWQVNPAVNGDDITRLFVYWTADASVKTGCYKMLCQGFVQIDPLMTPGYPFPQNSYIGSDQYELKIYLYQDRATGNWWVAVTENGTAMGYWPKELFGYLDKGADQVAWGGIAKRGQNGMSPPLGSGNLPTGNFRTACYIRGVNYVDDQNKGHYPKDSEVEEYVCNANCYGLLDDRDCGFKQLYYCFTFGGPGGKCGS